MASIEFDQSLKAVMANLEKLKFKDQKNLIRGAARAAAKPILDDARQNVPVESGALRDSIRISTGFDRKTGEVIASIKAGGKTSKGDAYYAHMVEYGTNRHLIKGPVLIGGRLFLNIDHPGTSAQPFMRPAFDKAGQASVDAYSDYIKKRLPILLAKNGIILDGD
jgi:HK97 gp10 family phage protein